MIKLRKVLKPPVGMVGWISDVGLAVKDLYSQVTQLQKQVKLRVASTLSTPISIKGPGNVPVAVIDRTDNGGVNFMVGTNDGEAPHNARLSLEELFVNISVLREDFVGNTIEIMPDQMALISDNVISISAGNNVQTDCPVWLFAALETSTGTANAYIDPTTGQLIRLTSSARYKTDIQDAPDLGGVLEQLRPVRFHDRQQVATMGAGAPWHLGFVAEEVDAIPGAGLLVEYVDKNGERIPESVKYPLIAVLAIQELQRLRREAN